jgi:hypothetical protein
MPQYLTDLMLRKLNPEGQARTEIWDGRIPGFGVRVSGTGTKTFILMYRHRGRTRRLSLGRYPYLSLMQAREKATLALREVSNGNDPALIAEADDSPSFQFDAVVDSFIKRHCHIHNKASTAKETTRLLKKHFVAAWGKRDIRDIRQTHINAILDALVAGDKPSEANHALGVIKTLFQWCVDRDMLTISPCLKIKKPAKHSSRAVVGDLLRALRETMASTVSNAQCRVRFLRQAALRAKDFAFCLVFPIRMYCLDKLRRFGIAPGIVKRLRYLYFPSVILVVVTREVDTRPGRVSIPSR